MESTMTFGQHLVGAKFNPSNDSDVDFAKKMCADLADLIHAKWANKDADKRSPLEDQLYNHTIGEILNAQMNAVKFLTLKY